MVYIAQQLLNTALSLLLLVQNNPGVDYYTQQNAIQVANNAIAYATQAINQGGVYNPGGEYGQLTSVVKIPFVTRYNSGYGSTKFGCDEMIVYATRNITPTTQPLNAAYRELFNIGTPWVYEQSLSQYWYLGDTGYGVRNSLGEFYNLKFEQATIENGLPGQGVAHVYLKGDFTDGTDSTCKGPRPQAQIEAVAKQFPNIYSVQIHLSN